MSQSRDLQGREGGPHSAMSQRESGLAQGARGGGSWKISEGSTWVTPGLGTGRRRGGVGNLCTPQEEKLLDC